ncbi:hypothetical protein [Helicobacter rodentium]|uniref:hypothetical protein n=1 Tax=Helicobacter rodentium TaxID=59617 RepID=UPI0025580BF4|nr:hypothetical protein [Helicobacter rodentium]
MQRLLYARLWICKCWQIATQCALRRTPRNGRQIRRNDAVGFVLVRMRSALRKTLLAFK